MSNEETPEIPEIVFDSGLPGFPSARRFALVAWEEGGPFSSLKCLDDETIEFVVVPPIVFFPDYEPEIDDATAERIGLKTADDALLVAIVSIAEDVSQSTANLLGPIVINRHTLQAIQAVLQHTDYEVRTPLVTPQPA